MDDISRADRQFAYESHMGRAGVYVDKWTDSLFYEPHMDRAERLMQDFGRCEVAKEVNTQGEAIKSLRQRVDELEKRNEPQKATPDSPQPTSPAPLQATAKKVLEEMFPGIEFFKESDSMMYGRFMVKYVTGGGVKLPMPLRWAFIDHAASGTFGRLFFPGVHSSDWHKVFQPIFEKKMAEHLENTKKTDVAKEPISPEFPMATHAESVIANMFTTEPLMTSKSPDRIYFETLGGTRYKWQRFDIKPLHNAVYPFFGRIYVRDRNMYAIGVYRFRDDLTAAFNAEMAKRYQEWLKSTTAKNPTPPRSFRGAAVDVLNKWFMGAIWHLATRESNVVKFRLDDPSTAFFVYLYPDGGRPNKRGVMYYGQVYKTPVGAVAPNLHDYDPHMSYEFNCRMREALDGSN